MENLDPVDISVIFRILFHVFLLQWKVAPTTLRTKCLCQYRSTIDYECRNHNRLHHGITVLSFPLVHISPPSYPNRIISQVFFIVYII